MPSLEQSESSERSAIQRSAIRRLDGGLRAVIAMECFGVGGRYLFGSFETESDIYGWLYFDCQWPEGLAQGIDTFGAILTLATGLLLCLTGWAKRWQSSQSSWTGLVRNLDGPAAAWIAAWMLLLAMAHMMRAAVYAEISLAEHAVRYVAPVALLLLGRGLVPDVAAERRSTPSKLAIRLLLVATSATFAAHGYKAMEHYGPFTDLILLSDLQWPQWNLTQETAERLLTTIGVVDLVVAFLLLASQSRAVALYMAAWGFMTAASRITALGVDAWPETVVRIANGGVPLVIAVYWLTLQKRPPPTTAPANLTSELLGDDVE
ncbi:hypothetical protein [Aureliella helgolandensis]|uniref:Uncharacterized protein n=1 Tax=Aureliella helgolandensis TaxID=2527968 RepID=A0A518G4K5_9BACT|nr:hypothetical protein [Aureliella helgolandensis]QDV23526.1 hypothetical protein Q31a_18270 [Aureliella helgolandensis]